MRSQLAAILTGWLLVCCAPGVARAQLFRPLPPDLPELETDRDAFTPAATTVTRGVSILESSYSFIDNRRLPEVHSFPETLYRYGLTERIELRLGWNYEAGGGASLVTANESAEGLADGRVSYESHAMYGIKLEIIEQQSWLPKTSAILEGFTPTSGTEWASQPVTTVVAGWELANRWRFDTALRYSFGDEANDAYNRWAPSAIVRIPVTEELHAHLEFFSVTSQGWSNDRTQAYISPGWHYNFTPDFELGLRVGWGISAEAASFFANTGFGWRF